MPEEEVQAIKWFSELKISEIPMLGIQGRALSTLYQNKFSVPPGFVLTAKACQAFLAENKVLPEVEKLMPRLAAGSFSDDELKVASERLQGMVAAGSFSPALEEALREAYEILNTDKAQLASASAATLTILKNSYEPPFVAVRCSPVHEEQLSLSPAFMNVKGIDALVSALKECYQSLLAPQQLRLLASKGDALPTLPVIIQSMIDADISGTIACRGEAYVIEAVWGLGSLLASGEVEPDRYEVRKEHEMMMMQKARIGTKEKAMTRDAGGKNIVVSLPENRKQQQLLTAADAQRLAKIGEMALAAFDTPYRVAFALTQGELHIVGCRPDALSVTSQDENAEAELPPHELAPSEATVPLAQVALSPTPVPESPLPMPVVAVPVETPTAATTTNSSGRLGFRQGRFPVVYHAACSGAANDAAFLALATIVQCASVTLMLPGHLSNAKPRAIYQGLEAVRRLSLLPAAADITLLVPHATQPRHFEDVRNLARTLSVPETVKLGIRLDTPAAVQLIGKFCDAGVQHIEIDFATLAQHLLGQRWNPEVRELFSPAVLTALRYVHRHAERAGIEVSIALPREAQLSPHDLDLLADNGAYAYNAPLSHAPYFAHLLGTELRWHAVETLPVSQPLPPASTEDVEEVVLAQLEAGDEKQAA